MIRISEISLPLEYSETDLQKAVLERLQLKANQLKEIQVFRRGYDARKKHHIRFVFTLHVRVSDERSVLKKFAADPRVTAAPDTQYQFVAKANKVLSERPVVIGAGPAGLFATLLLAQMGLRPIMLERGKEVRPRTVDTFNFWEKGQLVPESNVQFGEGGAGTFSDGKLHTQIKDRHFLGRKVLEEFVAAGAPEEILYISKPHIGTFRLVKMVENIRRQITDLGGSIRFEQRVDKLEIENGRVQGVVLNSGEKISARYVALAIGHSARDTFAMLHTQGVHLEAKPFSIGFRVEHPQSQIDQCRFGDQAGHPLLGAADYKLVHHCKNGRSVYSFCMCPGGTVVAAASEPGCVVTNGMSQYSRNERNANAAIVVDVTPRDFPPGPLGGIAFQRQWEQRAFELGGRNYRAPAQLLGDFMAGRPSQKLGQVQPSYKPGVTLTNLETALPPYAIEALREALPVFDKKIKGFLRDDAVFTAVETRTSSPLRIARDKTFQSVNTRGLYPCGEGAGYAGGILSSAVDGIKVAEALALALLG